MRSSSLHPTRWPTGVLQRGHMPKAALKAEAPAATGSSEARQRTARTSAAGPARDCRRSDARAAEMQVRPLSVVSGTAGSGPFGQLPFGRVGRL